MTSGVDIELNDAVNRIRFERPEVRIVVITSARERVFCSGANIFMLGVSSHAWKVNFCKYTNETRNGLEDFVQVRRPEVPGRRQRLVRRRRLRAGIGLRRDHPHRRPLKRRQPARGAVARRAARDRADLTRLTDKRHVRHDLADVFCTTSEGVRGEKALNWRLVDAIAKPAQFAAKVQERALALAATSDRPLSAKGVVLTPVERAIEADAVALFARHGDDRPRSARRHLHDQGAGRPSAAGRRRDRGRRRRLVSAGARP